jgi:hypothetical protein
MASFIDAHARGKDIERRIILVDPNASAEDPLMRVPVHQRYFLHGPGALGGFDLKQRSALDRIVPQLGSLVGAILNEARVVEADKVYQTRERFQLRKAVRGHLKATLAQQPSASPLRELIQFCQDILDKDKENMIIPPGALQVTGELKRVIAEEGDQFEAIRGADLPESFVENPGGASHKDLWLRALAYVAVDLVMNLGGKIEENKLVAIAPVDLNVARPKESVPIPLPGGALAGFAGFASEEPGRYETEVAKYCAKSFLEAGGLIRETSGGRLPRFTAQQRIRFAKDLKEGLEALADRVNAVIRQSHLINVFPGIDQLIASFISRFIKKKLDELIELAGKTTEYEFRIEVPDKNYEFDGRGISDRDVGPVRIDGRYFLITFARFARGASGSRWGGAHLTRDRKSIRIDKAGYIDLDDRQFCAIRLPTAKQREQAEACAFPIFQAKIRKVHHKQDLPSDTWVVSEGASPLEESIF